MDIKTQIHPNTITVRNFNPTLINRQITPTKKNKNKIKRELSQLSDTTD